MGMFGLRAQIRYHQRNFPSRRGLSLREYNHYMKFVDCLRACEYYVYRSHVEGFFVPSAI